MADAGLDQMGCESRNATKGTLIMMIAVCFFLFAALVAAWLAAPTTAPTGAVTLSPSLAGAD